MKINVQVKTRSKKTEVVKLEESSFLVRVNTSPVDGAANKKVTQLLADHFGIAPSFIKLVRGAKSKNKVFEILKKPPSKWRNK